MKRLKEKIILSIMTVILVFPTVVSADTEEPGQIDWPIAAAGLGLCIVAVLIYKFGRIKNTDESQKEETKNYPKKKKKK